MKGNTVTIVIVFIVIIVVIFIAMQAMNKTQNAINGAGTNLAGSAGSFFGNLFGSTTTQQSGSGTTQQQAQQSAAINSSNQANAYTDLVSNNESNDQYFTDLASVMGQ